MRRSLAAASLAVLCAVLLAACGDSDSVDRSSTATVPDGRLAATDSATCAKPQKSGYTVTAFSFSGSTNCAEAQHIAGNAVGRGRCQLGWNCLYSTPTTPSHLPLTSIRIYDVERKNASIDVTYFKAG